MLFCAWSYRAFSRRMQQMRRLELEPDSDQVTVKVIAKMSLNPYSLKSCDRHISILRVYRGRTSKGGPSSAWHIWCLGIRVFRHSSWPDNGRSCHRCCFMRLGDAYRWGKPERNRLQVVLVGFFPISLEKEWKAKKETRGNWRKLQMEEEVGNLVEKCNRKAY